ncbi:MAG: ABC transporter permease [Pseudomonadota bacterium]
MARGTKHALAIRDLHVYYGASHALQGVNITLTEGVHAVLGRNGMGKTTLCNAIMGMKEVSAGSIKFDGKELTALPSYKIASMGVGYTPQGRRLWPDLTVHDHLRLCQRKGSAWTVDRVYAQFPRLAERRRNGGAQLSGGEQQMLAISRALLSDPELLILDEPTEGLAPVIVDQVIELLKTLGDEGGCAILLVEQNIKVATEVAEDIAIMVNGRISNVLPAAQLAGDRALQQQLLGVGRVDDNAPIDIPTYVPPAASPETSAATEPGDPARDLAVRTARNAGWAYVAPDRWSGDHWKDNRVAGQVKPLVAVADLPRSDQGGAVIVAGTYDTKAQELGYLRDIIRGQGVTVRTLDLSTSGKPSAADIPPHIVAAYHPRGASAVFTGDRGSAVAAMAVAFERWVTKQDKLGGIISAAGSGGTALATPAMRALPIGVPKVMVSTVASGDVAPYVGPSDMVMMYSVTDFAGLNSISRQVLGNAASAMAGMAKAVHPTAQGHEAPLLGLTMFGVTTPAVTQVIKGLGDAWEPLVFHATGTGGRSMEKLADNGLISAAMDLTTTEVADLIVGGVFSATEDRFDAFIRSKIPWVGSVGATDMVNFGEPHTVPEKYAHRNIYYHNPQVTLLRTSPEENVRIGQFMVDKMNRMEGPVRFLIPEGGVSAIDCPGGAYEDLEAREALYSTITAGVQETANRRVIRVPCHINDPAFAEVAVAALRDITPNIKPETSSAAI